jgi:RNA polymerase sigma factor (sigma-70 family)
VQSSSRRQDLPERPAVAALRTEQVAGSEPEQVLARCRMGDTAAWDELVARYEWLVFGVARRNGLSREDAADVTQATFLALLESLETIRAEDRLASWLMTVSRRQSWALRNRALREAPGADLVVDRIDDHDPLASWEELTVLHDALDELARPCRDLLRALYFDPAEPSYRELADRFGFRIGGIGPMRARCLRRLRQFLGEDVFA